MDRPTNDVWTRLQTLGADEVDQLMDALPADLRQRLGPIPITFEDQPNDAMIRGGINQELTLGLFTGVPYPNSLAVSQRLPPQIILFLGNIWRCSGAQEPIFRMQVRKTLLHEIGHYLGLGEQEVRRRGLG